MVSVEDAVYPVDTETPPETLLTSDTATTSELRSLQPLLSGGSRASCVIAGWLLKNARVVAYSNFITSIRVRLCNKLTTDFLNNIKGNKHSNDLRYVRARRVSSPAEVFHHALI